MTDQPLPQPGWYPDPSGSAHLRWWDGQSWSDDTHPLPQPPVPQAFSDPRGVTYDPVPVELAAYPYPDERPVRRNRVLAVATSVVVLGVVVALGISLVMVLQSRNRLDTRAIEGQIAQTLADQTGSSVRVDCPSDVDLQAGGTFKCVATASNGATALVEVQQQDGSGNVVWRRVESG